MRCCSGATMQRSGLRRRNDATLGNSAVQQCTLSLCHVTARLRFVLHVQSRCGCGRDEASPRADVGGGEPSPTADVGGGVSPFAPAQLRLDVRGFEELPPTRLDRATYNRKMQRRMQHRTQLAIIQRCSAHQRRCRRARPHCVGCLAVKDIVPRAAWDTPERHWRMRCTTRSGACAMYSAINSIRAATLNASM